MTDKEQITCDCKYCMENPTCYKELLEEQLARKTQECEELKRQLEFVRTHRTVIDAEKNRYRKALEEIKRICLEDTYTFTDGTTIRYDTLDDILDIVNRGEGEENE